MVEMNNYATAILTAVYEKIRGKSTSKLLAEQREYNLELARQDDAERNLETEIAKSRALEESIKKRKAERESRRK